MSSPSISELASASEAAYDKSSPVDYTKVNELSSADISTYKHNVKPHYIIAHRGTSPLGDTNSIKKDVRADLNIALGNKAADALHKSRTKKTEAIVTAIKKKEPSHDIYLTGHSLGGSTSSHAMASSQIVRENVKAHDTFGSGSSLLQRPPEVTPEVKALLLAKSTHHRVRGDEIAAHVADNLIGNVKIYNSTKKPSVAQHLLKMATPLLKRSFAGRLLAFGAKKALDTLQSHSLDNFIKRR
jgi:hypothetical protein